MDGGWIERIEKYMKKRWMVGWIKKQMNGWLDGQKIYEKIDGWLDG